MARTLDCLPIGQSAHVLRLRVEPGRRQRLMDLGFITGQTVTALMRSPLGDPVAYQVLDTVIALRKSDASQIDIA